MVPETDSSDFGIELRTSKGVAVRPNEKKQMKKIATYTYPII
jgi:hypothetical protein